MTSRAFATGLLSALFALMPITGFAHHDGGFDDYSYDDLYDNVGAYDDPYHVQYGSTYYGNNYRSNDYFYDERYGNSRDTYNPQYTMPGFRCYYWGRDGTCMNYSYRQAPSYYGGSPYGYNNYGYQNNNYGYRSRCNYQECY
ncbi:MAG: hypothetical protein Greene041662_615 [Candidatus Peregrinibacteria bacterium Greene0416_62]|nr:MAG: hypothetical protein Greene041662_615 [Candidatus Peregrinibacteria bacterium Greene0416_62]TSD00668.1 MAG: hypothetical protein Greene101449_42 [Candidatus Peregrinibacteria bacterium Greene1014_49]